MESTDRLSPVQRTLLRRLAYRPHVAAVTIYPDCIEVSGDAEDQDNIVGEVTVTGATVIAVADALGPAWRDVIEMAAE